MAFMKSESDHAQFLSTYSDSRNLDVTTLTNDKIAVFGAHKLVWAECNDNWNDDIEDY